MSDTSPSAMLYHTTLCD